MEQTTEKEDAQAQPETTSKPRVALTFQDLEGDPIEGMNIQVVVDGKSHALTTDAKGEVPEFRARPGAEFELKVMRFNGSYKSIDACRVPGGSLISWQYVSPNTVYEVTPELHEGEPGEIEQCIPKPAPGDLGERAEAAPPSVDGAQAPSQPNVAAPRSDPVPPPVAQSPAKATPPKVVGVKPPAKAVVPPNISGKAKQESKQASGRDSQGRPVLVLAVEKVRDWWGSWHMPTLNLWGVAAALPTVAAEPGVGTIKTKVPYRADMLPKVAALLGFAEEQVRYIYGKEGTTAVLTRMVKGTFKPTEFKGAGDSKSQCYKYVKVALARAKVIDGILGEGMALGVQESASKAGPALLAKGFIEVTDELPDARWAAVGDVIVYEWSDQTWADRKKKNPSTPNHGHIDIRSVTAYISDFIPDSKHPRWIEANKGKPAGYHENYTHIKIYRKYFDPLPMLRIQAFLRCLREFECQGVADADRYKALNTPLPTDPKKQMTFSGFDVHPWEKVPKEVRGTATAAGAYQMVYGTWREAIDRRYFPDLDGQALFSPAVQDRLAVLKIETKEALHLVRSGDTAGAIAKLKDEWTSLPGAKQNVHRRLPDGKPMDIGYFNSIFATYLAEEKRKWGVA